MVGLTAAFGLLWLVNFTKLGMLIRAGASNRTMVAALGIDIRTLFAIVFAIGATLAGIAGMLIAARAQKDRTMMLVTHLAPAIIEASDVDDFRVDGIEARGLDAELELIVDRTPIRNHLARSTPELIVKRLVERSNGHAKALFGDILKMF